MRLGGGWVEASRGRRSSFGPGRTDQLGQISSGSSAGLPEPAGDVVGGACCDGCMVELVRSRASFLQAPLLDEVQQSAVSSQAACRLVLGAPGTGKSLVAVEAVVEATVRGLSADSCVILSPTRVRASALRDRTAARLATTSSAPMARTPQALGFGILRRIAAVEGREAPRLLTGPEQDVILRDLLAGHAAGAPTAPNWPTFVHEALPTRGFRHELRDLLMRAVEWGVDAEHLRLLGQEHERPEWIAAAQLLDEYDQVTALSRPGAYDPAWIIGGAADLLEAMPEQLAALHDELRLIVVDDAQELTRAGARLVSLLTGPSTRLMLIGDPDAAVQTFRGADPRLFIDLAERSGQPQRFLLPYAHRTPRLVREAAERVTMRIGAIGGSEHRQPAPAAHTGRVEVAMLRAVSQESAHIAAELRRAHLEQGLPWSHMAVITRGQARITALRRVLGGAGVPVALPPTVTALRDEAAVRPLLSLFAMVAELAADRPPTWAADDIVDLLSSPLMQTDSLSIRRLRRALRAAELASGGGRSSDELLTETVLHPEFLVDVGHEVQPLLRISQVLAAGVRAWHAADATAETVLWQMWSAAGVADAWERSALAGGAAGARADHDLDAVVALFGAAAAFVDRLPGAEPRGFLEHIREQEVAGDRLSSSAPQDDAVALLTTQAAAGREWQFVVLAGVQEGVWPDLRLRGSLLGSEALVDVLTGRPTDLRSQAAAVRYDETRQFLVALTRASERVLITAVRSDEEQPSAFLDIVDPIDDPAGRPYTTVGRGLTLRAMVAELRRELVPSQATADDALSPLEAARLLAELSRREVAGADHESWWAFHDLTCLDPVRRADQPVRVSPSKVADFTTCGLRWFLTSRGGDGPDVGAANIGTLVHEIAAEFADSDPDRMQQALTDRWRRLGLGESWISRQQFALATAMLARVRRYVEESSASGWTKVAIEQDFSARQGRVDLAGQVDRIERHPDLGLRIIDLKTGSSAATKAEVAEHPQLGAYQWAVEQGAFGDGEVSAGAALLQVGKATNKPVDNDAYTLQQQPALSSSEHPDWAAELLRETAEGMGGNQFLATPGQHCTTCAVRSSCPVLMEGEST